MVKKIENLVRKYGFRVASIAAAALLFVANSGAGTYSWAWTYQPEPPK